MQAFQALACFVHIRMKLGLLFVRSSYYWLGRLLLLRSALFVSNAEIAFSCRVYGAAVWHW